MINVKTVEIKYTVKTQSLKDAELKEASSLAHDITEQVERFIHNHKAGDHIFRMKTLELVIKNLQDKI